MYENDMTRKEIERAFAERSPEDERLIRSLANCDRRHFLKVSLKYAGMAAAAGLLPAHAFQLIDV
jgi:hypothetical protein